MKSSMGTHVEAEPRNAARDADGNRFGRRRFLEHAACAALATAAAPGLLRAAAESETKRRFKLGLVTYNAAADWDLATLLENCRKAGVGGVEFRTTHKHGVEPTLDSPARSEVRKRCADAGVTIWGLGSTCEFHSTDSATVKKNIATCAGFVKLAADLGARGVKVRPNGLPKDVPVEKTVAQIASALMECGRQAGDAGVEIWLEVHGAGTQDPKIVRSILDACPHPAVGACWNSNGGEVKDGSIRWAFDLLKDRVRSCHINDLDSKYPYRELFALFRESGYDRYTLCEYGKGVPAADGAEFLRRYRTRWEELSAG